MPLRLCLRKDRNWFTQNKAGAGNLPNWDRPWRSGWQTSILWTALGRLLRVHFAFRQTHPSIRCPKYGINHVMLGSSGGCNLPLKKSFNNFNNQHHPFSRPSSPKSMTTLTHSSLISQAGHPWSSWRRVSFSRGWKKTGFLGSPISGSIPHNPILGDLVHQPPRVLLALNHW